MTHTEIFDTTLRDGPQGLHISLSKEDHIKLFKELDNFGVDYIELGWPANASNVDHSMIDVFKECVPLAKKSRVVAFGSTSKASNLANDRKIQSLVETGAGTACIFGKSWLEHVERDLQITPNENLEVISRSIDFLRRNSMEVFYDAEHFFDGYKEHPEYALQTLLRAEQAGATRLILCDTNGGSTPEQVREITSQVFKMVNTSLGIHTHNDRGQAVANAMACLKYVKQVQGTMHGRGERAGNMSLAAFIGNIVEESYKLGRENPNLIGKIDSKKLKHIYEVSCFLSGIEPDETEPYVGDAAFVHKGGVHQNAVGKGGGHLYEHVPPELFGNRRIFPLNTLGGKSSVALVASQFGYTFDKRDPNLEGKVDALFAELKKYENEGYRLGTLFAEQFLLIEKYFGGMKPFFVLDMNNYHIEIGRKNGVERSSFWCPVRIDGELFVASKEVEGGPIDAADKAINETVSKKYPGAGELRLIDYHVSLARRNAEESTVRNLIYFENGEEFKTVGVSENIIEAGVEALVKGLQYHLWRTYKGRNAKL
ncbi:citramalate synthase [Candidatus Pacearchaeota archaeon]|nr:citramalate synthase [Candidatus Pacearchaeota archaeon]